VRGSEGGLARRVKEISPLLAILRFVMVRFFSWDAWASASHCFGERSRLRDGGNLSTPNTHDLRYSLVRYLSKKQRR
jgi:hypothetical protein